MKNKLFALMLVTLLITGCNKTKTSSSSEEPSSSSSSEQPAEVFDYDGYYKGLSWTSGEDLKQKLYDIMRDGYQPIKYEGPNWESNTDADHKKDDCEILDVIYSSDDVFYKDTNKKWQREHAFCASLMTGSGTTNAVKQLGRATDFHNLIASSQNGNSSRQNKNYGVADKTNMYYTDRTVNNGYDGYSFDEKTFEPGNKDKGRVARAIFYMATMYKETEEDTVNNVTMKGLRIVEEDIPYVSGNNCNFAIGHLSDLLNWNNTYAVDYLEMQHNESVYSYVHAKSGVAQGNRNPYVDFPQLVDYVYGDKQNVAGSIEDLTASMSLLGLDKKGISHYTLKTAKREYNFGETLTSSDYVIQTVNNDFSVENYVGELVHSLTNHTFTSEDKSPLEALITIGEQEIKYNISLDPMMSCSNYYKTLKDSSGISNAATKIGTDQTATFVGVDVADEQFTFNIAASSSSSWTFQNINEDSSPVGFKMGSGTNKITNLTITSLKEYTIDEVYLKARAGNAKSLTCGIDIYVGSDKVFSSTLSEYQSWMILGQELASAKTGKIKYVFNNSNGEAISLSALAFNVVE